MITLLLLLLLLQKVTQVGLEKFKTNQKISILAQERPG